jgi:hypothetical protein
MDICMHPYCKWNGLYPYKICYLTAPILTKTRAPEYAHLNQHLNMKMNMDMPMPDMSRRAPDADTIGNITEFKLNWPLGEGEKAGSTHELVINQEFIFVTGQNMHKVAKFDYTGKLLEYYNMPANSGPHGLVIDKKGQLWVSLEFAG